MVLQNADEARVIAEGVAAIVAAAAGAWIAGTTLAAGLAYWDLHGNHEFMASVFASATGHALPASARILKGESLGWDFGGNHDTWAPNEASRQDHELQLRAVRPRPPSFNTAPAAQKRLQRSPPTPSRLRRLLRLTAGRCAPGRSPPGSPSTWCSIEPGELVSR
jgi:hypothetical protein